MTKQSKSFNVYDSFGNIVKVNINEAVDKFTPLEKLNLMRALFEFYREEGKEGYPFDVLMENMNDDEVAEDMLKELVETGLIDSNDLMEHLCNMEDDIDIDDMFNLMDDLNEDWREDVAKDFDLEWYINESDDPTKEAIDAVGAVELLEAIMETGAMTDAMVFESVLELTDLSAKQIMEAVFEQVPHDGALEYFLTESELKWIGRYRKVRGWLKSVTKFFKR